MVHVRRLSEAKREELKRLQRPSSRVLRNALSVGS